MNQTPPEDTHGIVNSGRIPPRRPDRVYLPTEGKIARFVLVFLAVVAVAIVIMTIGSIAWVHEVAKQQERAEFDRWCRDTGGRPVWRIAGQQDCPWPPSVGARRETP